MQPDIQKLNERLAKRRELETLLERFDREMSPEELEELLRDIREKYAEKHPGLVLPAHMRTYRDAVFRLLFNDKKSLLELYNALTDRSYTNPDDLIITTLNENIYISMNNDVSFIIGSELVLTEQQSSVCPNMALRFLLYIADLYRAMVDMKRLYSSTMQQVPMPHYRKVRQCRAKNGIAVLLMRAVFSRAFSTTVQRAGKTRVGTMTRLR